MSTVPSGWRIKIPAGPEASRVHAVWSRVLQFSIKLSEDRLLPFLEDFSRATAEANNEELVIAARVIAIVSECKMVCLPSVVLFMVPQIEPAIALYCESGIRQFSVTRSAENALIN